MVEKPDAGRDVGLARAVEIEREPNLGLGGFAVDGGGAGHTRACCNEKLCYRHRSTAECDLRVLRGEPHSEDTDTRQSVLVQPNFSLQSARQANTSARNLRSSSRPVEAGFAADAFVEFAQEAADDVPAAGAADFDVALPVDADDRLAVHAGRGQVAVMQFVVGDDSFRASCRSFR